MPRGPRPTPQPLPSHFPRRRRPLARFALDRDRVFLFGGDHVLQTAIRVEAAHYWTSSRECTVIGRFSIGFDGHLEDVFPSKGKGVGIFRVVMVITAVRVFSSATEEVAKKKRYMKMRDERNSLREESGRLQAKLRLVAVPTDSGDRASLAK